MSAPAREQPVTDGPLLYAPRKLRRLQADKQPTGIEQPKFTAAPPTAPVTSARAVVPAASAQALVPAASARTAQRRLQGHLAACASETASAARRRVNASVVSSQAMTSHCSCTR